jgi:glutamyl-tRNA reductase
MPLPAGFLNRFGPGFAKVVPNDNWNASKIPNLTGKVALVTGANTGLGFETALKLAEHGAKVYVASRSVQKGRDAIEKIKLAVKGAKVEFLELNLGDVRDVSVFCTLYFNIIFNQVVE